MLFSVKKNLSVIPEMPVSYVKQQHNFSTSQTFSLGNLFKLNENLSKNKAETPTNFLVNQI